MVTGLRSSRAALPVHRHLARAVDENRRWAAGLVSLDLSFCELLGDDGIEAVCGALAAGRPKDSRLQELRLSGCKKLTDRSLAAVGAESLTP